MSSASLSAQAGKYIVSLAFSFTVLRYHNRKQLKKKVYLAYSFRGLESKRQGRHGMAQGAETHW